ncbi:HIT domain-containing protein [Coniochaeta sp. 2T2.1]|nr:HIT domain-containing protein [Coniochaeta sp. 2T2.1]
MSSTESEPEEAITKEEITQQAPAPASGETASSAETDRPAKKPRNAFTELMRPKHHAPSAEPKHSHSSTASKLTSVFKNRDGLGAYLADPKAFPSGRVIYHNEGFVVINDLYPKASVHTLLLPRSTKHNLLHPLEAFEDAVFLSAVQAEANRLRNLVAKELKRRFADGSHQEIEREKALAAAGDDADESQLPPGRDWLAEVKVGVHLHPSMSHLHVHVFSRDMHSPCLKHRKHYNSFTTPFLIDVADFPLAEDDPRRIPHQKYLDRDMVCWRCGKNFSNKFRALKEHLEEEFEKWKAE